ncbi:unnamed protein product, partial [Rotaria sp. Silwood1]
ESYHGVRGSGDKKKTFTIRVYPFGDYQLRCQESCSKIIQDVYGINDLNEKTSNKTQIKNNSKANEELNNCFGHLGHCPLTTLKYINYGKSFLTDSLHTIYGGGFKRLMQLLFDRKYRKQEWSLFKKINHIDELLSHIKIPSTTQRIDKDFINTVHGTVHFAKQLIRQHVLFRDAIVRHRNFSYPLSLFTFNEQLLNRKQSLVHYQTIIDGCSLPKSVSSNLYDNTEHGIAAIVQSYFKDPLIFFHS